MLKKSINHNFIILKLFISHYIILYYIILHYILHFFYYLFTICLKVAMVRLKWRGLDCYNEAILGESFVREADGGGGNTTQGLLSSGLHLFFFEVILISRIDGIRNCFEYYISLFLFDVSFHFLHSYVRVLSLWNLVLMIYHCLVLYTFISFFLQVFSWVWLRQVFDENKDQ